MRDADEIHPAHQPGVFRDAAPHQALANHHCCRMRRGLRRLRRQAWMDIALDDVLAGRETALLSVAAWRYHLPAVMIWCIRAPEAVDVIQDNLVYQLEPPADGGGVPVVRRARAWILRRAAAAIAAYLHWYREREETQWAGAAPPRHVHNALAYWAPNAPMGEGA